MLCWCLLLPAILMLLMFCFFLQLLLLCSPIKYFLRIIFRCQSLKSLLMHFTSNNRKNERRNAFHFAADCKKSKQCQLATDARTHINFFVADVNVVDVAVVVVADCCWCDCSHRWLCHWDCWVVSILYKLLLLLLVLLKLGSFIIRGYILIQRFHKKPPWRRKTISKAKKKNNKTRIATLKIKKKTKEHQQLLSKILSYEMQKSLTTKYIQSSAADCRNIREQLNDNKNIHEIWKM